MADAGETSTDAATGGDISAGESASSAGVSAGSDYASASGAQTSRTSGASESQAEADARQAAVESARQAAQQDAQAKARLDAFIAQHLNPMLEEPVTQKQAQPPGLDPDYGFAQDIADDFNNSFLGSIADFFTGYTQTVDPDDFLNNAHVFNLNPLGILAGISGLGIIGTAIAGSIGNKVGIPNVDVKFSKDETSIDVMDTKTSGIISSTSIDNFFASDRNQQVKSASTSNPFDFSIDSGSDSTPEIKVAATVLPTLDDTPIDAKDEPLIKPIEYTSLFKPFNLTSPFGVSHQDFWAAQDAARSNKV